MLLFGGERVGIVLRDFLPAPILETSEKVPRNGVVCREAEGERFDGQSDSQQPVFRRTPRGEGSRGRKDGWTNLTGTVLRPGRSKN